MRSTARGLCLLFWGPSQNRVAGFMHRVTCLRRLPLVINHQTRANIRAFDDFQLVQRRQLSPGTLLNLAVTMACRKGWASPPFDPSNCGREPPVAPLSRSQSTSLEAKRREIRHPHSRIDEVDFDCFDPPERYTFITPRSDFRGLPQAGSFFAPLLRYCDSQNARMTTL